MRPPTATIRTQVELPLGFADGYATDARVFSFDGLVDGREHLAFALGDCAAALRTIPRGEVVSYGELAALAGAPGAARAACTFCARSHLSIFVPCHRVVAAGGLGSYGSYGVAYKRRLLALEGYPDAL